MQYRFPLTRYSKIGLHEIAAIALVALGTILRFLLIVQNWPATNSDEATMGLMALHIVQRGEHPIFFYGQHYMGSLEAFVGAVLFQIFGPSTFALRLGLVIFFMLFLICMYYLTARLYSKNMALITLLLLSLTGEGAMRQELIAIGGYPELLLLGGLMFALATKLALTSQSQQGGAWRRALLFGAWGLAAGLAIWSTLVAAPLFVMAGLLLVVGCWREWRSWALPCLVLGVAIGAFPLLWYNLHAAPGQDSLSVLRSIRAADKIYHLPVINQFQGTFLISLPIITGVNPTCTVISEQQIRFDDPHPFRCFATYTTWGVGLTLLWMIALLMVIIALWKIWPRPLFRQRSYEERQAFIRQFARLTLLGATALTVYFYVTSPNSAKWPQFNDRYLIGVLIALPAVIWPLWADIRTTSVSGRLFAAARSTILALFALALLAGTLRVFALVPDAQQAYQQRTALISYLQRLDVKHIYSEYWTCNAISFQSNEQVICAVIDGAGNPIDNRYVPYVSMVQGDPHAAYVVPSGSAQAAMLAERSAQKKAYYQHFTFGGYEIYLPQSGHF